MTIECGPVVTYIHLGKVFPRPLQDDKTHVRDTLRYLGIWGDCAGAHGQPHYFGGLQ
jgi:hypothetical protein